MRNVLDQPAIDQLIQAGDRLIDSKSSNLILNQP